jgi:hypothetical protein
LKLPPAGGGCSQEFIHKRLFQVAFMSSLWSVLVTFCGNLEPIGEKLECLKKQTDDEKK